MEKRKARTKHLSYVILFVLVGFILLLAFSPMIGIRFDVVLSGSMSPSLNTGDLVIVTSTSPPDLKEGDIIVFSSPLGSGLVCHRIVKMEQGNEITFQTKGDNNEDPDPFIVPSTSVVGKVQAGVPMMGYVVQYLSGPFGLLLIISLIVATILIPDANLTKSAKIKEDGDADVVAQGKG